MTDAQPASRRAKGDGSIWQRADGTWKGSIPLANGKRKGFSAPNQQAAERKQRELLNRRDGGTLTAGKAMKLGPWLDRWLTIGDRKLSTTVGYRGYIERDIKPALGHVRLDKLTIEWVEDFYADLTARGLSGKSIRQHHSILRAALGEAVRRGHVGTNVVALVKPPSVKKKPMTVLSSDELARLLAAAAGHRYEVRYHLALEYGFRPSEILGLEWSAIDLSAGTLSIRQQFQQIQGHGAVIVPTPKSDAGLRTVKLGQYIVDMLIAWRRVQLAEMAAAGAAWNPYEDQDGPHAFVFTQADGQPLRPGLDTTLWKRLLDQAMIPATRRYTTRHTAASMMIADGVDVATVSKTLGHTNIGFTMDTYVHSLTEAEVALADRIEARQKARELARELGL